MPISTSRQQNKRLLGSLNVKLRDRGKSQPELTLTNTHSNLCSEFASQADRERAEEDAARILVGNGPAVRSGQARRTPTTPPPGR